MLHRDVKPSNLIVDGRGHLWVTDFGLARFQGEASLTATGDMLGTLRYMSPEQALANRAVVNQRTDVYSLGATLYELLTLRPAYEGSDRQELLRKIAQEEPRRPSLLNPAVPRDLETIIIKAMAKDPAGRYATAQDLADDFDRFLDDRPILARRPGPMERSARWARRHLAALVVAVSLLVLGLAAGMSWCWSRTPRSAARPRRGPEASGPRPGAPSRRCIPMSPRNGWGSSPACNPSSATFLLKALAYYQAFALERDPDPAVRAEAGEAALRVAEIQRKLGAHRRVRARLPAGHRGPGGHPRRGARRPTANPTAPRPPTSSAKTCRSSYSNLGQLLIDTGRIRGGRADLATRRGADPGAGGRHRRTRRRTGTSWRRPTTGWASCSARPAARARRRPPIARPSS